MPTGYTAKLMESGQTFPEFAMQCARAFGACVEMRDDPMDAPIPEKFEPSDYSVNALKEANVELNRLNAMTSSERIVFGSDLMREAMKSATDYLEKAKLENERLEAVEKQVKEWIAPTGEHEGLKEFMLQQIGVSKNDLSYSESSLAEAKEKQPLQYFQGALESAKWSVEYHTKSRREDKDRAESRTRWVKQLRDSLNTTPISKSTQA